MSDQKLRSHHALVNPAATILASAYRDGVRATAGQLDGHTTVTVLAAGQMLKVHPHQLSALIEVLGSVGRQIGVLRR